MADFNPSLLYLVEGSSCCWLLLYGTNRFYTHLAILFNLFINFGHLPRGFTQSVMIPLVKNKSGDLSDINNYRAIAISPALTKLF